jgi:hypothetical protein
MIPMLPHHCFGDIVLKRYMIKDVDIANRKSIHEHTDKV